MIAVPRSPENEWIEKLTFERLYEAAVESLNSEKVRCSDFRDLYDPAMIKADLEYVRQKRLEFGEADDIRKWATILEVVIHEQIELSEWLGSGVTTVRASDYDDIRNGIDTIVEFLLEGAQPNYLALAVDVTFSPNIEDKLERIKQSIREGKLGYVKYFKSERFRGELRQVPVVVVGTDIVTAKQLGNLWQERKKGSIGSAPCQLLDSNRN